MTQKNDGGRAFPAGTHKFSDELGNTIPLGMSMRDWFAGQALAGLTSDSDWAATQPFMASEVAYEIADAMIAARGAKP